MNTVWNKINNNKPFLELNYSPLYAMWIRILWCLWYYLVSVSEYWNRYSAFFCPVWCFLCSWFHFQTSDMCGFTLSFFRFIFFPFPLYHHFSFITAEFQCRFKLSSCLILILFLWFLIFPDDGLHLFFFLHIPVKHFLPLDSSWFLHGGNMYLSHIPLFAVLSDISDSLQRVFYTSFFTFPWNRG